MSCLSRYKFWVVIWISNARKYFITELLEYASSHKYRAMRIAKKVKQEYPRESTQPKIALINIASPSQHWGIPKMSIFPTAESILTGKIQSIFCRLHLTATCVEIPHECRLKNAYKYEELRMQCCLRSLQFASTHPHMSTSSSVNWKHCPMTSAHMNRRRDRVIMNGLVVNKLMNVLWSRDIYSLVSVSHNTHRAKKERKKTLLALSFVTTRHWIHCKASESKPIWKKNIVKSHDSRLFRSHQISLCELFVCVCGGMANSEGRNADKFMWINLKWIDENNTRIGSTFAVDDSEWSYTGILPFGQIMITNFVFFSLLFFSSSSFADINLSSLLAEQQRRECWATRYVERKFPIHTIQQHNTHTYVK